MGDAQILISILNLKGNLFALAGAVSDTISKPNNRMITGLQLYAYSGSSV